MGVVAALVLRVFKTTCSSSGSSSSGCRGKLKYVYFVGCSNSTFEGGENSYCIFTPVLPFS